MFFNIATAHIFLGFLLCFERVDAALEDGIVKMADAGGENTLTLRRFKGRLWPVFPVETLVGMSGLKARDDDVLILTYPKSGCHWVWEVVRFLQAGSTDFPNMEKMATMLENNLPDAIEALSSPRTLNTHVFFELLPPGILANKKIKIIYMTRDPRDVAVSFYNHHASLKVFYDYHGLWKDYFPNFLSGKVDYESWFKFTQAWERGLQANPDLQVHITSYEAFTEDPFVEVERLASFLEVPASSSFIKEIVEKTSFDYMRNVKGAPDEKFRDANGPIIYRKGKVGDWRNWFTLAQAEEFDKVFEREMKGTNAYQLYSRLKHDSSETFCDETLRYEAKASEV